MSSRYSLRKRQPAMVLKDDYKGVDLDKLLAEHEDSGLEYRAKRDAKKQKVKQEEEEKELKEVFSGYDIPLDSLPALCIEGIYSMLDSPQDLYNLAFSSKYLASLVTPEIVIRSAVFNNLRKRDVRNRKIIGSVINYLTNRSIHVPSAHRMLRLLNAKSCERGDQCWGKNLSTGKPGVIDPGSSTRPFGLAICEKCVKFGTTNVPYSHFSRFQQGVAFYQWNKIMGPHTDPVTGELHGPLVQAIQLQQIEGSYRAMEERRTALDQIVSHAHDESGKDCTNCYEGKASAYVEIFQTAENEADRFVAEVQKKEFEKYQQRRDERLAKRLWRIKSIFGELEDLLGDCPHKDLALACDWREDDQDCLKFKCTLVESIMCHIVSAPAKTSEKMINDAATRIKEAFTILDDCKFLTFSFLEGTTNRFRQGMLEYCKTETTSLEIMQSTYADQAFLRQIEQNQTTKALIRALNSIQGALPRCFALSVVRPNLNVEDPENRLEDYRKLAEAVWKKRANIGHNWTLQSVKDSFSICIEEFRGMKKNAKDYLADPGSRAFLRRDPPNNNRPRDANFSRRDALHQVFSPSTTSAYFMTLNERVVPYDLLLSRNFQTLHDVHEAYWRRPNMFGYH